MPGAELAQAYTPSLNLHDFRFDHALHAGRMMFRDEFPEDVVVMLIEAESVALGVGLSAPVAAAIDKVASRVARLIEERLAAPLCGIVMTGAPPATVTVKRGSLYLTRAVYDRFFAGVEAVILLRRGDDLLILPVRHAAAGGYLLKLRNAAGDRVVQAGDFFLEHGIGDEAELTLPVVWDQALAGLCSAGALK